MNSRFKILAVIILLFILMANTLLGQDEKKIVLAADDWCPYNCNPEDSLVGYMVEIAEVIFDKYGYKVEYVQTSWNRAIFGTRTGQFDGIIGTGKEETPDFIFPTVTQGIANHTFYIDSSIDWNYNSLQSLDSLTVGVIENYSYGSFKEEYIEDNKADMKKIQVITGNDPLKRNLLKLKSDRLDVIIEDRNVMEHYLHMNLIDIELKDAGVYDSEYIYIAFSPRKNNSANLARILDEGMRELRNSGRLSEILDKYNIKDWK